jgi:hypothetical protein
MISALTRYQITFRPLPEGEGKYKMPFLLPLGEGGRFVLADEG